MERKYFFLCNERQSKYFVLSNKSCRFKAGNHLPWLSPEWEVVDTRQFHDNMMWFLQDLINEVDTYHEYEFKYRELQELQHGRKWDDDEAEHKLEWASMDIKKLRAEVAELRYALSQVNDNEDYHIYDPTYNVDQLEFLDDDTTIRISTYDLRNLIKAGRLV